MPWAWIGRPDVGTWNVIAAQTENTRKILAASKGDIPELRGSSKSRIRIRFSTSVYHWTDPSFCYKEQIERIGTAARRQSTFVKEIFPISVIAKQCIYPWIIIYFNQQDWLMLGQSFPGTD